ncbi:MAG: ATP-grasp domain-containing protein [Euryarchaeota archaeon]|jgi:predicted ATP-grasp superfamily ATP-dependent carboligase|uniref:ATP-grasp domain-containing protein n=1 Tax=Methanobacterium sp. MZD130B TaxID=3394378 RepID=UPI0017559AA1|nr:ATP-grasp domain-containing protein [Euryarchaeota archaeon]HHT19070.1 ATP-grasp domain-containing protein [Methanobacterium sp.]
MEKILVAGANTRAVACSLKKLGYTVYSADYFGVMDLRPCADISNSVLNQKPAKSCGKFLERFDSKAIEEKALEMVDDVDGIIFCAGVSPRRFPSDKIIGNYDIQDVQDKYRLFGKLKSEFNVPDTYMIGDFDEALDIASDSPEKNFILKPRHGSGGYGIQMLNLLIKDSNKSELFSNLLKIDENNWIMQEFIDGENISASVLSTKNEAHTILNSCQIIGNKSLGQLEPFGYCGNIVPYPVDGEISETAEKIIDHLSLIGSNGVDFIIKNDELYVVEVNPRLQGTFECAEIVLGVNMAELHLKACQGHLMKVSLPERFAVKMIIHAQHRSQVGNMHFKGIHDLPNQGVIIEKGEPVVTVLTSSPHKEDAITSAQKLVQRVYTSLKPVM